MKYAILLSCCLSLLGCYGNTPKDLKYSEFCKSRGGIYYDEYRSKTNTFYCKNGEHTHVPD